MKTTGFPRIRLGSRARMVGMAAIGLLALEIATNEAGAGDCNIGVSPLEACNGLEQTPDYKNLVSGQGTVTEDDLNGPWIETIKRVRQCNEFGFPSLGPIINYDDWDPGDESDFMSISGPSLIRVPDEDLAQSLCREADSTASKCYYLYYANHHGEWIRMSYAKNLSGPWTAYRPGRTLATGRGVLYRRDLKAEFTGGNYQTYCTSHIGSPDVQIRFDLTRGVDFEASQEANCQAGQPCYVMYFHCPKTQGDQRTFSAISRDGKEFYHYATGDIGSQYASLAQIFPGGSNSFLNGRWLHVSRRPNNNAPITMTEQPDTGLANDVWTERGCATGTTICSGNGDNHLKSPPDNSKIHHVGITAREQYLYVFFHRRLYDADRPMHLRVARIDMHDNFASWDWESFDDPDFNFERDPRESFPVMAPVTYYERFNEDTCGDEGVGGPPGSANGKCDIRDPNVFVDNDGRTFLVYSYAREKGLAIAEIKWQGDAILAGTTYGDASTVYANCQDIFVSIDAAGNASIEVDDVDDGSSGCGITLSIDQSKFTCAHVGTNGVTLTVTDDDGNMSTCIATVTVTDGVFCSCGASADVDDDGILDCQDNCLLIANPDQRDVEVAGAVSVWRFDEGTGTTAIDSFGSNDGTIVGAVYASGQVNTALDFNGADNYVSHNLSIGTQGTVVHWLRPAQIRPMVAYYESNGTGGSYDGFSNTTNIREIHSSLGGSVYHFLYQDGLTPVVVTGGTPAVDTWAHVAVTWDTAGDLILYVDGVEVDRQALSTVTLAGHPATIRRLGRVGNAQADRHWHGLMDETAVFDRALSADEINGVYTLGLSDGVGDACDICPGFDDKLDADSDSVPDACDICPGFDDNVDVDFDGIANGCDNCPTEPNADQLNGDQLDQALLPIAVWQLEDGSGTVATDGFNTWHGTVVGASWTTGRHGGGLDFDGSLTTNNQRVEIGDVPELNNVSAFSIAFWFQRRTDRTGDANDTNHNIDNVMIAKSSQAFNDNIEIGSSGANLELYLDTAQFSTNTAYLIPGVVTDGKWTHLVLTYDQGRADEVEVYINGGLVVAESQWGGNLRQSNGSPLTLGLSRVDRIQPWGDFDGLLDEVAVFGRALSDTEVAAIFLELGDGVGDACDKCPGHNDNGPDADGDGVPDACDVCPGFDDNLDSDGDGVADGCDVCLGDDATGDSDGDGVCDSDDICPGGDDTLDADMDTVPDFCDICPLNDDTLDADADGVPDGCDVCPGSDDAVDTDSDGVPDGCDICPGGDDSVDTDVDGVPDLCDICPGFDDNIDADADGVPDGCDICPGGDDSVDTDADGVPDFCDICPEFDDTVDADTDGVPNGCDICPGFDDNIDADSDGVPDGCDNCIDTPNPDQTDADGDGVGDACDDCDNSNNDCANALLVTEGQTPFCNEQATTDGPSDCLGNVFVRDVWFRYVAPAAGILTVDTCGAPTFDTVIEAYSGTCEALISGPCDNDTVCPPGSSIDVPVSFGDEILIRVGGVSISDPHTGTGVLTLTFACNGMDSDGDGDLDLDDYGNFESCLLGPGGGIAAGCDCFDADNDGDVTLADFGDFQVSLAVN